MKWLTSCRIGALRDAWLGIDASALKSEVSLRVQMKWLTSCRIGALRDA
jgi:hypothetical protein